MFTWLCAWWKKTWGTDIKKLTAGIEELVVYFSKIPFGCIFRWIRRWFSGEGNPHLNLGFDTFLGSMGLVYHGIFTYMKTIKIYKNQLNVQVNIPWPWMLCDSESQVLIPWAWLIGTCELPRCCSHGSPTLTLWNWAFALGFGWQWPQGVNEWTLPCWVGRVQFVFFSLLIPYMNCHVTGVFTYI